MEDDIYKEALKRAMKKKYSQESLREDLAINPEEPIARIGEQYGMAGMGSIKDVSSILTPEAQALREIIQKKNKLENVGEPQGKLIKVEGGGLEDIRAAQKDYANLENKALEKEASDKFWSIKNELKMIEDKGKYLNPFQIKHYQERIDDYFNHPMSDKDPYARNFLKASFNESLRRLDLRNYQKQEQKMADIIKIMRKK